MKTTLPARWFEGKTALITDVSSAIGQAFAAALARRGTHLLLVAPSAEPLHVRAALLSRLHAVSVEVIAADLTHAGAAEHLAAAVAQMKRQVDVLVTSDGCDVPGRGETLPPEGDSPHGLRTALAVGNLAQIFLPAMLARGRGAVITLPGAAAVPPLPQVVVSGALQALWAACRAHEVSVLAVCPGATDLAWFAARGPEQVVASALRALERQQRSVGAGWFTKLLVQSSGRFLAGKRDAFTGERVGDPCTSAG